MLTHLFIDSFNALLSEFETNTSHIFTHPHAKLTHKIETFTIELLTFKAELYQQISKLIKVWTAQKSSKIEFEGKQTLEKLKAQIQTNNEKLYRYRLHNILKKKAVRKQRQSMVSSQSFCLPSRELQQLEKSILLIEKDLGIQEESEQNQKLGITRIINKSLSIGLQSTPNSQIYNQSVISYASSEMDITSNSHWAQSDQQNGTSDKNRSKSIADPLDRNGIEQVKERSNQSQTKALSKKPMKKKKVIVSKSDVREGLLGNLLQQTYNQCLHKK